MKYLQIISFFGIIILVTIYKLTILKGFLGILSIFNMEFLKIPNGMHAKAAFSLIISSIFYLVVFIGTIVYLSRTRVIGHDAKMIRYGINNKEYRDGLKSI